MEKSVKVKFRPLYSIIYSTFSETQRNGEKYKEISKRGAKNQRNVTEASKRKFIKTEIFTFCRKKYPLCSPPVSVSLQLCRPFLGPG